MAKNECANYDEGYCAPRDKPCIVICENGICGYFRKAVLPWSEELHARVLSGKNLDDDPARQRICIGCGKNFVKKNNRQIYCSSCAQTRRLEKERERKRNACRKKRMNSAFRTENNTVLDG